MCSEDRDGYPPNCDLYSISSRQSASPNRAGDTYLSSTRAAAGG